MNKRNIELINKAMMFAVDKHRDQLYGDKPFIHHPLQVYEIIQNLLPDDSELQIAAILHDTLEQTETTKNEIEKEFGTAVMELVDEVTKTGYNTFPKLESPRAVSLKFADRLANLVNMKDWTKEKQTRYINKSKFWKS